MNRAIAIYFSLVLAFGVARFGSAAENQLYLLFLLLLPAALAAGLVRARDTADRATVSTWVGAAIGLYLLASVALRPTVEARGHALAAIAWLSFFVTRRLASDPRSLRLVYLSLILIGAANAAYGLVQAIGGVDQIGTYQRELGRMATGTYINRNHFAGLLNMTLGLGLGALFAGLGQRHERGRRGSETAAWAWLAILCCALLGLAVFLSLSRAGSAVLVASLFFATALLMTASRRGPRRAAPARIAALLLIATLAIAFGYGIDALLERVPDLSESNRPEVFRDTLDLIADHPWLGVGPGMYRWRFRPYQTAALGLQYSQTHSDYLQTAAEWGIPLALAMWGFVLWVLRRAVRLARSASTSFERGVGLGCAVAIFGMLLHSLVDFNLQIPANLAVFSSILALALAAGRPARSPAQEATRPRLVAGATGPVEVPRG